MVRRSGEGPGLSSTFAVGEEAEAPGEVTLREMGAVAAPIDRARPSLRSGSTARVDVVVRTRNIGHFFPAGTVDAFDVWLELRAADATGRIVFWSGRVEDGGKGPVERGAHFYRSYQLDGAGNAIDKRNAWQARSLLYVRLIPPGAADVAHFRLHVPPDAKGPLTLEARLNYRKFSYYYTQFAYAGQPRPGQDPALLGRDHNSLAYSFDPAHIPANVSGEMKGVIPDLPIVTLASAKTELAVAENGKPGGEGDVFRPVVTAADRERWNDWGIGLLLQGDLKGAEYAFEKTTEADPGYADGWLNLARALIREGETERARPYVAKALALSPGLARALFFQAMIDKTAGNYAAALAALAKVEAQYPRDRVVVNQIARLLFLEKRYPEALKVLERVCEIDPEDLQMHYTAMLCWRALGNTEHAEREAMLFRRFKADEGAQALTAKPRRLSPEDNNERQMIHDHESVPLDGLTPLPAPSQRARRPAAPSSTGPAAPTAPAGG
ncbi:MAG: tetratricopeptide repeat protein, partial [Acidobacteriota bacterium]